jgi:glycosyltransferase involved in cell wall biosynthesis
MKVLLVGNYEFDGSTSMKIWANTLYRELTALGIDASLIAPRPIFGRMKQASSGLGKWCGYIDRFLLFPWELRAAAAKADLVHLVDHGSAMYALMLKGTPVVVTCNDMHAVLGARGEVPDCPASAFGRVLQNWICRGLKRATGVACISQATFNDAKRILKSDKNLRVILDALNHPFQVLAPGEAERRLAGVPEIKGPFILHVGSNLTRKNREGVMRIFAQAAQGTGLQMVFAGQALSPSLIGLANELQVDDRIVQVVKPDVEIIEALYNRAVALLFPSRYEGFGWPPIEAQACGCPVVSSDIPPVAEVMLQSGAVHRLEDETGMAASVRRLAKDKDYRENLKQLGFENIRLRFQTSRMMSEYVSFYRELVCQS